MPPPKTSPSSASVKIPPSFLAKKARILSLLSVPTEQYDDLSPKGSVDEGIRELIDEINGVEGWVTTSSCGGRVSVFLEGVRGGGKDDGEGEGQLIGAGGEEEEGEEEVRESKAKPTKAGVGGKGGGGRWLFVTHDPIPELSNDDSHSTNSSFLAEKLGLETLDGGQTEIKAETGVQTRYIHFKFEPMILHVLTASTQHANLILSAALQAGFRESGALNLLPSSSGEATPMVGIRSMGLALESIVGMQVGEKGVCIVPEWQLQNLIRLANSRFAENEGRIGRFRGLLKTLVEKDREGGGVKGKVGDGLGDVKKGDWEDADVRRERMRAEGLRRKAEAIAEKNVNSATQEDYDVGLGGIDGL